MDFSFNDNELKMKTPFCAIISGQSGSGKTTLLMRLIRNIDTVFTTRPSNILYCYGQYNTAIPELRKLGVTISAGFPSDEQLRRIGRPLLLILDDLMLNLNRQLLADLFTRKSHHSNISIIFIVQNLFEHKLKIVRDNCQYIFLLNSPSSALQIRTLGSQIFPKQLNFFLSAYNQAVADQPFGYLLIDLHPQSKAMIRLRSKVFKETDFTEVYTPI